MDCLTAQRVISDALDHAPVDATALSEAKSHCRQCASCSVFVRAMLLVKNAPLPELPADIVDRVMVAVRAEAKVAEERETARMLATAQSAPAAGSEAAATASGAAPSDSGVPVAPKQPLEASTPPPLGAALGARAVVGSLRRWVATLSRRELVAWAGAAAMILVATGVAATSGIRIITTQPASVAQSTTANEARELGAPSGLSAPLLDQAPAAGATDSFSGTYAGATAPSVITVTGLVFVLSGPSSIATGTMRPTGTTVSALGGSASPTVREVLANDVPGTVYVFDDVNQQLLAFTRVVRTYNNVVYQLTSAEVPDFGQWPTLPAQIPAPAKDDGSPTFSAVPPGAAGETPVYRLASADASAGIAIAPGTDAQDPAAGNPNWTWWAPVR